jgi:hypothetical protein
MQPDKDTVDAIVGLIRRNPTLIDDLTELLDADSDAKNARLAGDDTDRWSAPADDLADSLVDYLTSQLRQGQAAAA